MRRIVTTAGLAMLLGVVAGTGSARAVTGGLEVVVTYTGSGQVDAVHEIFVFLFDHPVPTAESVPLAVRTVSKSGGTATFRNVAAEAVYVVMVYDEKDTYDGTSAPPKGLPIGTYSRGGKPLAVKPGATAKIAASFDDSRRW